MNINQIRDKYRKMLDSDTSSQESIIEQKVKCGQMKTVLTEQSQNLSCSNVTNQQAKIIISLKERIAQGLKNLTKKEVEITDLNRKIVKIQQKSKLLEQQLTNAKKIIQKGQNRLIESKINIGSLQNEIKQLQEIIKASQVDKELVFKQNQYYKNQISSLKSQKKTILRKMELVEKEVKAVEKIKQENLRFRDDIKRMHFILNEYSQKHASKKFQDKHYLGKPYKEHHSWFSQNLVGEVQQFLKRQQVGAGNKQFTNSLIKFIDRYAKSIKKQSKNKEKLNAKLTQNKSKLRSLSLCQMGDSMLKSQYHLDNSLLKKSFFISRVTKTNSKKCTQSLLINQKKTLSYGCQQILSEYCQILKSALKEKQIEKKQILSMTKEMSINVLQLIEQYQNDR